MVEILAPDNGRTGDQGGTKAKSSFTKKRTTGERILMAVSRQFTRVFADSPWYGEATIYFFDNICI